MTAGERLLQLAGQAGAAGALLLLIGSGANAGAALVDYSGLATDTAAEHLLAERIAIGGAGQRKREEELWKNLPEFYQYKPKEEQKVEVLEKVFLPPTENVSPREIAEVLASAVKKIQSSSPLIVSEEDDEEALFMLMGWL